MSARWADSIALPIEVLLPYRRRRRASTTALRPSCFLRSSSAARKTASYNAVPTKASPALPAALRASRHGGATIELRTVRVAQSRFQILARRSQVLEQFHFAVKVDEKRFVLVLAQDVLEEFVAGIALLIEHARLAAAGIEEQAERERKIALLGEVADGLRTPVFLDGEFVLGQIVDDLALFVADGGQDADNVDAGGELGVLRPGERGEGSCQVKEVTAGQHHIHGRGWQRKGLRSFDGRRQDRLPHCCTGPLPVFQPRGYRVPFNVGNEALQFTAGTYPVIEGLVLPKGACSI